ncbi:MULTISPECIES: hypothetical protein [unclassified Bradyrhizobium]|uniref:hypothetical protein n=1 Tax=unclassified Bradyrhizobium TaxID=2631580 RepID=UPI00339527E5
MPNKSKTRIAEELQKKGIPRASWSKDEFCARHGISVGLYDKMKKLGVGPDENVALDRTIITVEAEERWLRKTKRKAASPKAASTKGANTKAASAEA